MPFEPASPAGCAMTDLAVTMLWPLVAVVLVLCGATLATSGAVSQSAGSAPATTDDRPCAGRRVADHLPGDRMMVVIAGGDSQATVRSALEAARRAGTGVTIVSDLPTATHTYDRLGSIERISPTGTGRLAT